MLFCTSLQEKNSFWKFIEKKKIIFIKGILSLKNGYFQSNVYKKNSEIFLCLIKQKKVFLK